MRTDDPKATIISSVRQHTDSARISMYSAYINVVKSSDFEPLSAALAKYANRLFNPSMKI